MEIILFLIAEMFFSFKSGKSKILKKRINQGGYYYVNLCKNGKYKSFCIHRLVGIYFVDKYNPK